MRTQQQSKQTALQSILKGSDIKYAPKPKKFEEKIAYQELVEEHLFGKKPPQPKPETGQQQQEEAKGVNLAEQDQAKAGAVAYDGAMGDPTINIMLAAPHGEEDDVEALPVKDDDDLFDLEGLQTNLDIESKQPATRYEAAHHEQSPRLGHGVRGRKKQTRIELERDNAKRHAEAMQKEAKEGLYKKGAAQGKGTGLFQAALMSQLKKKVGS